MAKWQSPIGTPHRLAALRSLMPPIRAMLRLGQQGRATLRMLRECRLVAAVLRDHERRHERATNGFVLNEALRLYRESLACRLGRFEIEWADAIGERDRPPINGKCEPAPPIMPDRTQ